MGLLKNILRLLPILGLLAACSTGPSSPSDTPALQLSNGQFRLTITSPEDLTVVDQPQVELQGEVSESAVLSINDDIYLVEAGKFNETVKLQEGINVLQIVASDMDGNEVDLILSITYQP